MESVLIGRTRDRYACMPCLHRDDYTMCNLSDSNVSVALDINPTVSSQIYGGSGGTMIRVCEKREVTQFFQQLKPHHLAQLSRFVNKFALFKIEGGFYYVDVQEGPYVEDEEVYSLEKIDYVEPPKKILASIHEKFQMNVSLIAVIKRSKTQLTTEFGIVSNNENKWVFSQTPEVYCGWCPTLLKQSEWKKCSGCRGVVYCDEKCQKAAWRIHKRSCKKNAIKK